MNPAESIQATGADFGAAVADAISHLAAVIRFRPFESLTLADVSAILQESPNVPQR